MLCPHLFFVWYYFEIAICRMDIADLAFSCLPSVYVNYFKSAAAALAPFLGNTVQLRKCLVQLHGKVRSTSTDLWTATPQGLKCHDSQPWLYDRVCCPAEDACITVKVRYRNS